MDISAKDQFVGIVVEDSTVAMFDSRSPGSPLWVNSMKLGDPIISLAVVNENRCIIGSAQKQVYDVQPTNHSVFYEMPHAGIDEIAIRCDGKIWATGGWDGRLRLFNAKNRTALAVLKHHKQSIHTVCFAADGLLASGGEDRGIALWSIYRKEK
jgi:WD40 repeat protein